MNITLKHKKVKIRRPKRCVGCASQFDKGETMAYWVGICEGDFQDNYWCLPCDAYLAAGDPDERSISYGEFAGCNDYLRFKANFYETKTNR